MICIIVYTFKAVACISREDKTTFLHSQERMSSFNIHQSLSLTLLYIPSGRMGLKDISQAVVPEAIEFPAKLIYLIEGGRVFSWVTSSSQISLSTEQK